MYLSLVLLYFRATLVSLDSPFKIIEEREGAVCKRKMDGRRRRGVVRRGVLRRGVVRRGVVRRGVVRRGVVRR
jgi:hypothetical protein